MGRGGKRRVLGLTISVTVVGCSVWCVVNSRPGASEAASTGKEPQTVDLSCGPAALLAVAGAHDAETSSRLRAILRRDQLAIRPVSSLYDLAAWGRQAGLDPIGLRLDAQQLHRLPLPAIVHMKPGHFLALTEVRDARVVVIDQGMVTREIPRRDFDRRFSGYVLCLGVKHALFGQSY